MTRQPGLNASQTPEGVVLDHDFHPDENTVRVFGTPEAGVLRLDDEAFVSETRCYGGILRHYAFSQHWFKINVSIDESGRPVATGEGTAQFAFNCDIATPMEMSGRSIFGVDLFVDVLVGADAVSFHVKDEDEFERMTERGLLSPRERAGARDGLAELLTLIRNQELFDWLSGFAAFGPCDPPPAPPMERRPIPARMQRLVRATW